MTTSQKLPTEGQPKLPNEEWDFRRIPDEFTWLAVTWEYARELPWFCSAWEEWLERKVHDWTLEGCNPRNAKPIENQITVKKAIEKKHDTPNSHLHKWLYDQLPKILCPHWDIVLRLAEVSTEFPDPILTTNAITPKSPIEHLLLSSALNRQNAMWFKPDRSFMYRGALLDLGKSAMPQSVIEAQNYRTGVFYIV
jgi:hypothetical protein